MKENVILAKSFQFALRIVRLYRFLYSKHEFVISKQILRSGTSVGANLEEAQGASSERDFLAKMNIVYKELCETRYWINLLGDSKILNQQETRSIQSDCDELQKLCGTIIKTLKTKQKLKTPHS